MYDIIGDIHGHADCLVKLLVLLGYEPTGSAFAHRDRKVIFLGDFIDRGPKIREVLEIVRPMIEEEKALAVMGNHELNALAYHIPDPKSPGEFLRQHNERNLRQHRQTLDQVPADELALYLKWFRTLPMWLDLDGLRVVHACWDTRHISVIQKALEGHNGITDAFLNLACKRGNALFESVEVVLKGKELRLPESVSFLDKDGKVRAGGQTMRTYAFQPDVVDCGANGETTSNATPESYPATAKPVFIGHYWLYAENPSILADNMACVDYSVAKGGFLCAYRWNGERTLSNKRFVWVGSAGRTDL